MRRLAASFDAPFRFDALLNARLDGSRGPLSLRLSPEEVVALDLADPARVNALREAVLRPPPRGAGLYACGAGLHAFAVDPAGRLRLCALCGGEEGFDLRRGSFREGWEVRLARERGRPGGIDSRCRACGLIDLCGICPEASRLECGAASAPVEFLCRVAHLRAFALGMAVSPHGPCELCPGGARHGEIAACAAALRAAFLSGPDGGERSA